MTDLLEEAIFDSAMPVIEYNSSGRNSSTIELGRSKFEVTEEVF